MVSGIFIHFSKKRKDKVNDMKKKLLIVAMAATMMVGASIPVGACTPSYKPVSSQAWYKSYQSALNSAYKAGQNMVINVKIDPKYFK